MFYNVSLCCYTKCLTMYPCHVKRSVSQCFPVLLHKKFHSVSLSCYTICITMSFCIVTQSVSQCFTFLLHKLFHIFSSPVTQRVSLRLPVLWTQTVSQCLLVLQQKTASQSLALKNKPLKRLPVLLQKLFHNMWYMHVTLKIPLQREGEGWGACPGKSLVFPPKLRID